MMIEQKEKISFALDELVPERTGPKKKGNMESGWMDGFSSWGDLDDVLPTTLSADEDDNSRDEDRFSKDPASRLAGGK